MNEKYSNFLLKALFTEKALFIERRSCFVLTIQGNHTITHHSHCIVVSPKDQGITFGIRAHDPPRIFISVLPRFHFSPFSSLKFILVVMDSEKCGYVDFVENKCMLNLPKFQIGDDPQHWIRIIEQHFDFYQVEDHWKVFLSKKFVEADAREKLADCLWISDWEKFSWMFFEEFSKQKYGFNEQRFGEIANQFNQNWDIIEGIESGTVEEREDEAKDSTENSFVAEINNKKIVEEEEVLEDAPATEEDVIGSTTEFEVLDENVEILVEYSDLDTENSSSISIFEKLNFQIQAQHSLLMSSPSKSLVLPELSSTLTVPYELEPKPPDLHVFRTDEVTKTQVEVLALLRRVLVANFGDLTIRETTPLPEMEGWPGNFTRLEDEEHDTGYGLWTSLIRSNTYKTLSPFPYFSSARPKQDPLFQVFGPHFQPSTTSTLILTKSGSINFPSSILFKLTCASTHNIPLVLHMPYLHSCIDPRTGQFHGEWNAYEEDIIISLCGTPFVNDLEVFDEMTIREWSNFMMNYVWEEEEMKKSFYVSMVFDSSQGMGTTLTTRTIQFTALKVFDGMHENELEGILTSGNATEGWSYEANKLFDECPERKNILLTKLIGMYFEKWVSQFYTTYEHYKDGLGFDIIVFNTYDEWMSGLDINAPWSFIAHGMDQLEDLKLTNCYGYSDGMSSLLMHIMTWVFELASCRRTLQTTISQHVSKEEEHVFQLLIKKFTLEVQALLEIKVIATRVLKCKLWNFEDVITCMEFMGSISICVGVYNLHVRIWHVF